MSELLFVKFGGSLLTDKSREGSLREDTVKRIALEIKQSVDLCPNLKLLIAHGGGSFAHFAAERWNTTAGYTTPDSWRGFAETRAGCGRLNQIVVDIFMETGLTPVALQPSASGVCSDGHIVHLDMFPIKFLLERGQMPIVYGDPMIDKVKGFTTVSTEKIFSYLVPKLRPDRIVLLGETNGVFTSDPFKNPNAKIISTITPANIGQIVDALGGSKGADVTGGMLAKVNHMVELVSRFENLRVQIASGLEPGSTLQAIAGNLTGGTTIARHQ